MEEKSSWPVCCQNLGRLAYSFVSAPDDTSLHALRKQVLFCTTVLTLVMSMPGLTYGLTSEGFGVGVVASICCISTSASSMLWLLITKRGGQGLITFVSVGWTVAALMLDFSTAVSRSRQWALVIVIVDILLVLRSPRVHSGVLVSITLVYLAIMKAEELYRFGLFDLPGLRNYEDRLLWCHCPEPPCAIANYSAAAADYTMICTVFLLDFFITRGFAQQVETERCKMEASVEIADKVASCLARFDLELAGQLLAESSEEGQLPPELHSHLATLLRNLRQYRPYLPEALFLVPADSVATAQQSSSQWMRTPPGTASHEACIVFTDIVGSTSLWAQEPEGMQVALQLHNETARRSINQHGGYEVKTIGDAFMVAFANATDAVLFGLDVQSELLSAPWPDSILQHPACARDDLGVWGGITVRIGVNHGPVKIEVNPVTTRADYFGHTVNIAARAEHAAAPGSVTLSEDVFRLLSEELRSSVATKHRGRVAMKGVPGGLELVALYRQQHLSRLVPRVAPGAPSVVSGSSKSSNSRSFVKRETSLPVAGAEVRKVCSATIGSVEDTDVTEWSAASDESLALRMTHLLTAAESCRGTVMAVVGRTVTVCFNVWGACHAHVESCMRFAGRVVGGPEAVPRFALGCSTGSVAAGSIGRGAQRFVNVVGECVRVAKRLGNHAAACGIGCLYVNLLEESFVPRHLLSKLLPPEEMRATMTLDPRAREVVDGIQVIALDHSSHSQLSQYSLTS
eukprot:Rhum_TRINITY_DN11881_c0_g1::Rhum_TRINITY_DN11881_c0_g1_i1::g.47591::m.47591